MTRKVSIITPTVGSRGTGPGVEWEHRWCEALEKYTNWDIVKEHILVWDRIDVGNLFMGYLKYPDVDVPYRCIINPSPVGISRAFNMGAAIAKGEYLCFLEDAVYVTEGWLDKLLEALETEPSLGWVAATQIENPKATFTSMCSLIRRDIFERVGRFDEQLEVFDDADLILRMREAGMADGTCSRYAFNPHGLRDVKVSHPETRTTTGDIRGGRGSKQEYEHFLEMKRRFKEKWGMDDFNWNKMPTTTLEEIRTRNSFCRLLKSKVKDIEDEEMDANSLCIGDCGICKYREG